MKDLTAYRKTLHAARALDGRDLCRRGDSRSLISTEPVPPRRHLRQSAAALTHQSRPAREDGRGLALGVLRTLQADGWTAADGIPDRLARRICFAGATSGVRQSPNAVVTGRRAPSVLRSAGTWAGLRAATRARVRSLTRSQRDPRGPTLRSPRRRTRHWCLPSTRVAQCGHVAA